MFPLMNIGSGQSYSREKETEPAAKGFSQAGVVKGARAVIEDGIEVVGK